MVELMIVQLKYDVSGQRKLPLAWKTFSKNFLARHPIPTVQYQNFSDYDKARQYVDGVPYNIVMKVAGLAAGKGVILPSSKEEAYAGLKNIMLAKQFGSAGDEVVIEESGRR